MPATSAGARARTPIAAPIDALIEQRITRPLECFHHVPRPRREFRGALSPEQRSRAAQAMGTTVRRSASRAINRATIIGPERPDVFLGTRHGALPRANMASCRSRPRCKGRCTLRNKATCHRAAQRAGAGVGDRRRGRSARSSRNTAASTTPRPSSACAQSQARRRHSRQSWQSLSERTGRRILLELAGP